jgi:hypothetical protein
MRYEYSTVLYIAFNEILVMARGYKGQLLSRIYYFRVNNDHLRTGTARKDLDGVIQ